MAGTTFNINYMAKVSSSGNSQGLNVWTYNGLAAANASTVAQIVAAGFFNSFMQNLTDGTGPLQIGDTIMVSGSDANGMYKVSDVTTNVEVVAFAAAGAIDTANLADGAVTADKLATDAVTTIKIDDAAVTLAKLATGITPSHVIKFAGQPTTSSGVSGSTHVVTLTGAVAATDYAFVQMVNDGTNNVTVVNAVVTTNTLTVTFSGAPGADVTYNYQVIRAAA